MKFKVSTLRQLFILYVLLISILSAELNGQCTNIHPDDLAALQDFYRATDGDLWTDNTGWDQIMSTTTPAVCDLTIIFGLQFTGNRVSDIRLGNNNLNGTISASLGDMVSLRNIDFIQNNLNGSIPRSLGRLGNLTNLRLSNNNLTGPIPDELGNLSRLASLSLSNNNLSGPIPSSLARLTNLQRLALNFNDLNGIIPRFLGRISSLEEIFLGNNNFRGSVPRELGNLTQLRILELQTNQLTGSIPRSLSRLHMLEDLNLGSNRLRARIPRWLGSLTTLQRLNLVDNRFRGTIPVQLGNLSRLFHLGLSSNMLTGPIPSELGNLTSLISLDLGFNMLTGPIPAELSNLSQLNYLDLPQNRLTGNILAELGNLSHLIRLNLFDNMLTGNIPGELGNLTSLNRLYLYNNDLGGCFHPNLRNLCGREVILDDAEFDVSWAVFCDGLGGECSPEPCTDTLRYFPDLCIIPREKIAEFGLASADCRVENYVLTDADGNPLPDTLYAPGAEFCSPVLLTYTCEDGRTCTVQIEISSDFSSRRFVSMTMQEYLSGTTLYRVRGCPGIYTYEDEEVFSSCEITRIKRTWQYSDICGHSTGGIQYIDIRDFFFCRFVGPFSLPQDIPSRIRVEIPPNANLQGLGFDWSVRSRDWEVLGQEGPDLLVLPGQSIAKVRVQISFPSGLVLRVRDIFKSYKPNPIDNRLTFKKETSGNDVIILYPNPVNSIVNVRMPVDQMLHSVQVMDRLGRVVFHQKIQAHNLSIPVADLLPGVYILRLSDGHKVTSMRFIKQ